MRLQPVPGCAMCTAPRGRRFRRRRAWMLLGEDIKLPVPIFAQVACVRVLPLGTYSQACARLGKFSTGPRRTATAARRGSRCHHHTTNTPHGHDGTSSQSRAIAQTGMDPLIRLPRSGQPRFRHGTTLTPHTAFSRPARLMMGEDSSPPPIQLFRLLGGGT